MNAVAYELPTTREELNRKTFETIEWLFVGLDKGRLTEEQFSVAVDALFMAVSGLVDKEFIGLVTAAQEQCEGVKTVVKRHFHAPAGDELLSLTWKPGEDNVYMTKRVCGMAVSGVIKSFDDAKAAASYLKEVGVAMGKKGWIEL